MNLNNNTYNPGEVHNAMVNEYNVNSATANVLTTKYEAVMVGVDNALLSGDKELENDANIALERLDMIAGDLINKNTSIYENDTIKLLEHFDQELDWIAEDLCLTSSDIEVSIDIVPNIEFTATKIERIFENLGIPSIDINVYIETYKKTPEIIRPSLETIEDAFDSINQMANSSDFVKSIINENRYTVIEALGLYINSQIDKANKTKQPLLIQ